MRDKIANLVVAAPKRLIFASLFLTLIIGSGAAKIKIQDDLTQVVPSSSPVRQAMTQLEATFGPSETLVVMLKNPNGTIFEQDFLKKLVFLSESLRQQRPFNRVQGITTVKVFERGVDGSLQPRAILDQAPGAASDVARIQKDIASDPDIQRAFVALDGKSTSLYVDPKPGMNDSDILAAIQQFSDDVAPYTIHLTGMPVVRAATTEAIRSDMVIMIPFVVLVLLVFLGWTFRSVAGVSLTILIVAFSILPGAGLMGYLGVPMTAINNTFPVLILAIACAGAIHVLSIFYLRIRQGSSREQAVRQVIEELALPVFIAALTTAAGFLSLLFSPIPPIGTLGWVVALGVIWAWALTTFVLPAALLLVPPPKHLEFSDQRGQWFFGRLASLAQNRPIAVLIATAVVLSIVTALGMPKLTRETRVERFFTEDVVARSDSEAIDKAFRGSTPLELIINEDVKRPEVLTQVAEFSAAVQELPEVGSVDSIVNIVQRIQQGFAGERSIPDDEFQIAQSLFLYSLSAAPEQYQRFVATDEQSFRVTVRMPNLDPESLERVIEQVRTKMTEHLDGLDVQMTGKALFLSALNEMVVRSALRSVLLSLAMVFLICLITFRHVRAGIEGMAPLAVSVLGVFGIMGLTGVPLTIASALVSAIVIGVGVDYGVHVLSRWDQHKGTEFTTRVSQTIDEVGRPIMLNALAVGCGLGVLALSRFQPIRHLGALSIIAMFAAALGALIAIPALKSIGKRSNPLTYSYRKIAAFLFAALLAVGSYAPSSSAAEANLEQILQIAYKAKGPETLEASMTMTLIDSGGKSTERSLEIRREGDDKQLVWFTAPANMRDTGFLRVVEDGSEKMWLYLPAFKKLERIGATDQKRSFLGSDFTYADMGQHNLNKYDAKLLGKGKLDGKDVHHIEFNLKNMDYDVLYAKIIAYVRVSDSRVVREDLYDKKGDLIKQKTHQTIENIGTYTIPTVIEMKDVQRDHITRLQMSDVKVDEKIPDRVFTTKYLQKSK